MTPARLSTLRARAQAAIDNGFETELVLGRTRSAARRMAPNYSVSLKAGELLELVNEFERLMTALGAVAGQTPPASGSRSSTTSPSGVSN